jgi:drug/metabolite transporter (DMT)-like permease
MELHVFLAVLAAAAFHAGWNTLLKVRLEPMMAMSLISMACGIVALPFVPLAGLPLPAAWPFILASLALHLLYYWSLAEAYRAGDLGQVYPIARGAAPLMTALGATFWLGEGLAVAAWCGILILGGGILMLSLRGGRDLSRFDGRSVGFALLTALSIAAYTLVDGAGARLAGSPAPYIVWLFVLDGVMMLAFGIWRSGSVALMADWRRAWGVVLLGGVLSTAAYAIAIWAMTVAPIALVAALRETSVLFAALLAVVVLKEPVMPTRVAAAVLVLGGLALIRLT